MANRVILRFVIGVLPAMGLVVAGPSFAACDLTLSSILPSSNGLLEVLEADCGRSNIRQITLTRDVGRPSAVTLGSFTISPATRADIRLTTPLISGTHWYTAIGWDDATDAAVNAGKAVVITDCTDASGVGGSPSCYY